MSENMTLDTVFLKIKERFKKNSGNPRKDACGQLEKSVAKFNQTYQEWLNQSPEFQAYMKKTCGKNNFFSFGHKDADFRIEPQKGIARISHTIDETHFVELLRFINGLNFEKFVELIMERYWDKHRYDHR
ncbi:MAG: hypothetical protein WCT18_04335 [Patescibacteria group bacterium]